MNKSIAYIGGMFESKKDNLFLDIQQKLSGKCYFIDIYPNNQFGAYSFYTEIKRTSKLLGEIRPDLIIAHSLGAYIAMNLNIKCPLVLLDPSLSVDDIILPNINEGRYFDGTHTLNLSQEFLESLKTCPSVEILSKNLKHNNVFIFGAGQGGFKIAERYHKQIHNSNYFFLPKADHDFSRKSDRKKILTVIQKQLGFT
ncbi:MAG: hypothetical protein WDZ85_02190 [Candidatus Paceibacterota bacterium]